MRYEHLKGMKFEHGVQDCYTILRQFYQDNFNITLGDYARQDGWWDKGQNLYVDNFRKEGFHLVDSPRWELKKADVILMAMRSPVANHCAIYLGDGNILHHFYGRFSNVELYKGLWYNATVGVIRHKDVSVPDDFQVLNILDLRKGMM